MSYKLTFLEDPSQTYNVESEAYTPKHTCITLIGAPAKEGGFTLVSERGLVLEAFKDYKTIYNIDGDRVAYSCDGSTFESDEEAKKIKIVNFNPGNGGCLEGAFTQKVKDYSELRIPQIICKENYISCGWEPEIPESGEIAENICFTAVYDYIEPVYEIEEEFITKEDFELELTLDELKEQKIKEFNETQQGLINAGTIITLSDGSIERFTATDADQRSLAALQAQVMLGSDQIPWHNNNQFEGCKYYSNANMAAIIEGVTSYVTYHVTYFRDIRRMILAAQSKEELADMFYGMVIPEEYQSEVLRDIYAKLLAADNIEKDYEENYEPVDINPDTNTIEAGPDDIED